MNRIEAWLNSAAETWEAKPELEKNIIAISALVACAFGLWQLYLGD